MRIAAFAIVIAFIGKLGAIISTIPTPVVGISIILFGMIAAVGVRTVVENQVDFKESRNLIIAAVILVLGIGGAMFEIPIEKEVFNLLEWHWLQSLDYTK